MGDGAPPTGHLLVGRYRLHELLGEDAGRADWRATDELLGRTVAVRRLGVGGLPPADAEAARQRTLRDARVAAALHHPHAVTVFDVVLVAGEPWLVLEYVRARTLADLLRERGPLPVPVVAAIGTDVAAALAAAHAIGVVHGSVGPEHVLLTDLALHTPATGPSTKLAGFGAPSRVGAGDDPQMTAAGSGSAMADDVRALGVTLRDASGLRSAGPPALLAALLDSLTAPDPAVRPTAVQAHRVLRDLSGVPGGAPSPNRSGPGHRSGPTRARRGPRSGVVAAAATVVLLACGLSVAPAFDADRVPASTPPVAAALPQIGATTIGDVRTADPCSLTDPAALSGFGTPKLFGEYGHFAECATRISSGDTNVGEVVLRFSAPLGPGSSYGGTPEQLGELTLVRYAVQDESCKRILVLSDRYGIVVLARHFEDREFDTCALAEAVMTSAIARLATDGIGTRVPLDAESSLAGVEACGLLGAADLAELPGLDQAAGTPGFGGWQCNWGDTGQRAVPSVLIQYVRVPERNTSKGPPVDLGAFPADMRDVGDGSCLIGIVHRSFRGDAREDLEDVVEVYVHGPQTQDELCRSAIRVATAAAARLPPP